MALSTPTWQGPPSTMPAMRSLSCSATCIAVVGLTCLNRFALGAARGRPDFLIISWAMGCDGKRTATDGNPLVHRSGMQSFLGSTSVMGPGQ